MNSVEKIVLVFENCEIAEIRREHIGTIYLSKYCPEIYRVAINCIKKVERMDEIHLEINSNADTKTSSFGMEYSTSLFDRIVQYNDITHIEVCYEDGSRDDYAVNYDGDMTNSLQKSKIGEFGDLYIVIGKDLDVDKIFPIEYTSDAEYREFYWDIMCEE